MENKPENTDEFPKEWSSSQCPENKPGNPEAFPGNLIGQYGMTLRDYFANSAMQGICADGHTFWDNSSIQGDPFNIARLSFEIADAMLKAREL